MGREGFAGWQTDIKEEFLHFGRTPAGLEMKIWIGSIRPKIQFPDQICQGPALCLVKADHHDKDEDQAPDKLLEKRTETENIQTAL